MASIVTVKGLRAAARHARVFMIQPRFGNSERWIKITKTAALDLIADLGATDTPTSHEMYTSQFGDLDGDTLYLG